MKKVLISALIVLVAVTCVFALTGCNKTLITEGTLTVATNAEFAPFEYTDDDGNPIGFDMDVAKAIADLLDLKLEIKDMAFESVLTAVASNQADIAMAGLTIRPDRQEQVLFCEEYYSASQVVIARKGDAILNLTDKAAIDNALKNKKIGYQNGTTGGLYVEGDGKDYVKIAGATGVGYTSGTMAVLDLLNEGIDYVIIDNAPAMSLVSKNSATLALNSTVLTTENYAFAVRLGNTELQEKINSAIATLKENGTWDTIMAKYF